MKRMGAEFWVVAALLLLGALAGTQRVFGENGPLHAPNRFPPHLMFVSLSAESPEPVPAHRMMFSMGIDYTSTFINSETDTWQALIDMEMTAIDLSLAYGLTDTLSLSITLPFVSMNNGFLDPFLEDFHNWFGAGNYGRKWRPKDQFGYILKKEGKDWFTAEPGGLHLVDSTLSAKVSLFGDKETDFMSGSLLYKLKMPTGEAENGFGSGGFDHGLFLLSRFRFSPITLYANGGIMVLSEPDTPGPPVPVNPTVVGMLLGGEYVWSDTWTLLGQINYTSSPFKDQDIDPLDDDSVQLIMGVSYEFDSGLTMEVAFSEDLSDAAPDFTVSTRFNWGIGQDGE